MDYWPHGPQHLFEQNGTYIVTGATYNKELFFKEPEDLNLLHDLLLRLAAQFNWHLQAWAVFPNHYHFVAQSSAQSKALKTFISQLHGTSARFLNERYKTPGRKIWHQYWDTQITFEKSYFARLNYVIQNPVRHGLVAKATQYNWCSASWFEKTAERSFFNTVINFKTDTVSILDDF